ncbi:putative holin [Mycolicibacterium houstonense]|uniref:putative holin n=1 Tax=Mycolicibacterium houstonense TaxID=146021 RepID=UPI0008376955|nr:putative holin [Mycolicibacterium houstonense]MCV7068648.1 putative holin [Mycolicibacterium farcinogenes]
MIPLPRAWLLTGAMSVGVAVGLLAGVATTLLVTATVRPDVVIALVLGVPGALGILLVLASGRRWVTALGAFVLAIAPGWFGALAIIQVASHA